MSLPETLTQLREERARINKAIVALGRIEAGRVQRRGRPPKWLAEAGRRQIKYATPKGC
jgi:hypothetical protein